VKTGFFARWQANFLAGLAIILPGLISIAALVWLFGTVANFTDWLLIFLPKEITHQNGGYGPLFWPWKIVALMLAVMLIGIVGLGARHYFGRRLIEWTESLLLRVPLLNKVYSAIKQVSDAFSSTKKTAFRTVVLFEFPRKGVYSIGFITSDQHDEVSVRTGQKVVCVFVPTTPNPTSGFLILVPEADVTKLDMSVADGIKYIISLGSIVPDYVPGRPLPGAGTAANSVSPL
jgi:uncharacterized membrane protein